MEELGRLVASDLLLIVLLLGLKVWSLEVEGLEV
jgi:hypothetical protein